MKYNYLLPPGKLPHLSRCNPRSTTNLGLLAAILCSSGSLAPLSGATPPTATVIYTSTGPILGGMAKGPDGVVYLAPLSSIRIRLTDRCTSIATMVICMHLMPYRAAFAGLLQPPIRALLLIQPCIPKLFLPHPLLASTARFTSDRQMDLFMPLTHPMA